MKVKRLTTFSKEPLNSPRESLKVIGSLCPSCKQYLPLCSTGNIIYHINPQGLKCSGNRHWAAGLLIECACKNIVEAPSSEIPGKFIISMHASKADKKCLNSWRSGRYSVDTKTFVKSTV